MTENSIDEPLDDLDFDAWLSGATVTTGAVEIIQKGHLLGKYAAWELRRDRALAAREHSDSELGGDDVFEDLKTEGRDLIEQIQESVATYHLRGLSRDALKAIMAAHPDPVEPETFAGKTPQLTNGATEVQSKAYLGRLEIFRIEFERFNGEHKAEVEKYDAAVVEVVKARGVEQLVRCIDHVEVGGQVKRGITNAQAERLAAAIGDVQVGMLLDEIARLTKDEPEIPADFSWSDSGDDQE